MGSLSLKKNNKLNFNNSGTLARLLIGILSTTPGINVNLTGDRSLNRRSMKSLINLMKKFGATFLPEKKFFWAYRKCYMFNERLFPQMKGERFLYLDLDILIHSELDYFFDLRMDKPYIVRGWWNDIKNCRKNFGRMKSTPLNSSVIRWNKSQWWR